MYIYIYHTHYNVLDTMYTIIKSFMQYIYIYIHIYIYTDIHMSLLSSWLLSVWEIFKFQQLRSRLRPPGQLDTSPPAASLVLSSGFVCVGASVKIQWFIVCELVSRSGKV